MNLISTSPSSRNHPHPSRNLNWNFTVKPLVIRLVIIPLQNNHPYYQMMVSLKKYQTFHVIFMKISNLECLFIKLFIVTVLATHALFLIGFKLLLSDLTCLYLDQLIFFYMEYHKEYQINYLLINSINLLFNLVSEMYKVIHLNISLDNCKIIRLDRCHCSLCLSRSQVGWFQVVVITIEFISVKSNQATKFLNSIKSTKDLTLTQLMKPI